MQQEIEHYRQTIYETQFYLLVRFFEESGYMSLMVFKNDIMTLSSSVVKYSSSLLMNSLCSLCVTLCFASTSSRLPWWHWGGVYRGAVGTCHFM